MAQEEPEEPREPHSSLGDPQARAVAPHALEANARRLRRNWYLPAFGLATLVGGYLVAVSGAQDVAPFGFVAGLLGLVFTYATLARNSHPLSSPVALRATVTSLSIGEGAPVSPVDVVEAKLVPKPGARQDTVAELGLRDGRRLALWMRQAEAAQLFHLLGVTAGERRASFRLALPLRLRFAMTALFLGLPWMSTLIIATPDRDWLGVLFPLMFGIMPVCLVLAWLLGVVRGRLVIGADGLTTRWLGFSRFVRFADVTAIEGERPLFARGVVDTRVTTRAGRRMRLRAPEVPDGESQRGVEGRALYEHLRRAFEHFHERAAQVVDLRTALGRGGRADRAWLAHLDGLVRGGAMRYRVATLDPELLVEVACDPRSPTDCRIGAAAALVRLDGSHRDRVRVAADACVEGDLQATLAALSEAEDDAAVEAALERGRQAEASGAAPPRA